MFLTVLLHLQHLPSLLISTHKIWIRPQVTFYLLSLIPALKNAPVYIVSLMHTA